MARNTRASKGMKKLEPAQLRMEFNVNVTPGGTSVNYIDLSQCASILNRRFYRQGLNWCVGGFKFLAFATNAVSGAITQPACSIGIDKLPSTWVMSNGWEKSFRAWQRMIKNATDDSGSESIKGKFLDFKIYADSVHHQAGFGANLLPNDGAGNLAVAGQWQPSEIQIPVQNAVTDTREFIAVGPNSPGVGASGFDAVSIVQGYADSRALPSTADPNVPADANTNWMVQLFDNVSDQDQDVLADLEVMGNNPPYPFEGDQAGTADTMYPGGETQLPALMQHDLDFVTGTTIGGTVYMQGGMFPCGLLQLGVGNRSDDDNLIVTCFIDLVPGNHRGYHCEPMTEM